MLVEEAGKVGVHAFVSRDELVGEAETWHESTFLQPEDCAETAREEDAFDSCKGDHSFSEALR